MKLFKKHEIFEGTLKKLNSLKQGTVSAEFLITIEIEARWITIIITIVITIIIVIIKVIKKLKITRVTIVKLHQ